MSFEILEDMVKNDAYNRYSLIQESDPEEGSDEPVWLIRANEGHSLKASASDAC